MNINKKIMNYIKRKVNEQRLRRGIRSILEASITKRFQKAVEVLQGIQLDQQKLRKAFVAEKDPKKKEVFKKAIIKMHNKVKQAEEDFNRAMQVEPVEYIEDGKIIESRGKKVTSSMWDKMNDDQKIDALLTVVEDPKEAEKYFEKKWNELPSGFERDMMTESDLEELDVRKTHGDKRIENPATGNAIKLRTALKAKKGSAVYAKGKAMYNALKDDPTNESKLAEVKSPVKIGDILFKGKRKGKVTKILSDYANVDFGGGDVYGIMFRRIKGNKISESVSEAIELVHVYKNGKIFGTGELVKGKEKGNQVLVRFDGSKTAYFPKKDVKLVERAYASTDGKPYFDYDPGKDKLTEKLARGLKPLLTLGSTVTKNMGEDKLIKLSDAFEKLDNERGDEIAGDLNMAIEKMQDGYAAQATGWLKKFNKECKKALREGKLTEAKLPDRFTVKTKFRVSGMVFNTGDYAKKKERMGKTMVLNMDNNEMLSIDYQDYIAAVKNKHIKEGKLTEAKDQKLAKLFQQSIKASVKDGEDKLYKLSQEWERWNVDNDDKYDDLVSPLFMAVELIQDAGEPGKNNVTKNKEYYSYLKSADKHLKQFNKDCKKALKGLSESKLAEVKSPVKIGDILFKGKRKGKVTKILSDYANVDFGGGDVYGIMFRRIKGNKIDEGKLTEVTKYSLDRYKKEVAKLFKNKKTIDDQQVYDEMITAFSDGVSPAKFVSTIKEGNLTEIKKGDWIRSAYDELGLVNKVKGQAAYVSFDGSRSFQPVRVADLKKTKERYKGKAVYSEGKLTEDSLSATVGKKSDRELVKLYNQMKDERLSGPTALLFRQIYKELKKRNIGHARMRKLEGKITEGGMSSSDERKIQTAKGFIYSGLANKYYKIVNIYPGKRRAEVTYSGPNGLEITGFSALSPSVKKHQGKDVYTLSEGKLTEAYDGDVPKREAKNFEKMCQALIRHIEDIKKEVKAGNLETGRIGSGMWDVSIKYLHGVMGIPQVINKFVKPLKEGKLIEASRISFRDMGISNLMDLKLTTDSLAKANINWNQRGQSLVFDNTKDAKKAKQILGLDEGKLNESRRDPASIKKEYKELKKQSIGYLRKEWSRMNKVGNPNSLDKEGLVSDILRGRHGGKYIDKAFEGKLTEASVKRGDTIKYDREFKFGKVSKGERAKVVAVQGHKVLLDNGQELDSRRDKFTVEGKLNERGNMRKGDFVEDEDGNVGIIMKMTGYTAYVKYTKSKRGTSSQQKGLTPIFNDDVDDTRKKHKGKTLWKEV